jgi:large subunit ribosomal protein L18e
MKRTGPTNDELKALIIELRKLAAAKDSSFWKRIADDLERPSRIRRLVNIHGIQRNTQDNDVIIVPGKVLSDGELDHKVTVAAFKFSKSAEDKIKNAGGKPISIFDVLKEKDAKKIKIIG